jgi:hypothetical protein
LDDLRFQCREETMGRVGTSTIVGLPVPNTS